MQTLLEIIKQSAIEASTEIVYSHMDDISADEKLDMMEDLLIEVKRIKSFQTVGDVINYVEKGQSHIPYCEEQLIDWIAECGKVFIEQYL